MGKFLFIGVIMLIVAMLALFFSTDSRPGAGHSGHNAAMIFSAYILMTSAVSLLAAKPASHHRHLVSLSGHLQRFGFPSTC
ncbi:MAG: hypothetical protein M5R42_01870 [Rhodocyclaceae bacterium]|nr:hypothetical protein [Rhodocyclaceae bacterium]